MVVVANLLLFTVTVMIEYDTSYSLWITWRLSIFIMKLSQSENLVE